MGLSITPQLTLISTCENTTGWSGGTTNDSFQLEGVNCLGEKVSQTLGSENMFTFGTNVNMTGQFFIQPMSITGAAETIANGGYRSVVIDGVSDKGTWYVGGSDTTNERWTYFVTDPSTAPTLFNGATNSDLGASSITRSGTTVTVNLTGHGLSIGDYIVVENVTQQDYNGSWAVASVPNANSFTYTATTAPESSPATGPYTVKRGIDFTDIDQVGVQMNVTTKAVGNTPNAFWDICRYGSGLKISSTYDSVTITRSGTTATVSSTGHGLEVGDAVRIAGITDKTEDNGDHVILTVPGANSYTYATTDSGSTSYTGIITSALHVTWRKIAAQDATNFWGICTRATGVNFLQGQFILGSDGSNGDLLFVDTDFLCVFRDNLFLPPSKNNIVCAKNVAGDDVQIEWSDGVIDASNTKWGFEGSWISGNVSPDDITMTGMSFSNFNTFDCGDQTGYSYTSSKFNRFDGIYPNLAEVDGATVKNGNLGSLGLILNAGFNIQNIDSLGSIGDSYITIQSTTNTEITLDNITVDDADLTFEDITVIIGTALNTTASSLVSTGTTATCTTAVAHGLATNDWIQISGANEAAYNGFFQITVTGASTFTYTMASDPVDTATGTILVREALTIYQINGSNSVTTSSLLVTPVVQLINDPSTVTLTVTDISGTPIQNARVFLEFVSTGDDIFDGSDGTSLTDVNGQVTTTVTATGAITGRIRKSTSSPLYKTTIISGNITGDFSATYLMVSDE